NTLDTVVFSEQVCIGKCNRCGQVIVVHEFECSSCHACQCGWITRETTQHARPSFSRLERQNASPVVARWNGLGLNFTFFELENDLQTTRKRLLKGRHDLQRKRLARNAQQQSVLVILNYWHYALLDRPVRLLLLILPFDWTAGPP